MICYFWKDLKPSIKVEIEQQNRKSMNFEEMMQKAVNAEAKTVLRSSIMVQDSDARCPRSHRPSHNTSLKMQTKGSKDSFCSKKPKPKDPKPVLSYNNAAESAKK